MKKVLLLLTSFVLVGTMMARQLTPDQALALALGRMNAAQPELTRAMGTEAACANLTHTETTAQQVPLYYVYNFEDGGFIIASADDRTSSLLGYTDRGDYAGALQNQTFVAWLKDCRKALTHIGSLSEKNHSTQAETRVLTTAVKPLLGEISWDQREPYCLLTPMRVGKNEKEEPDTLHALTGCMATAIAQVMMYHQWPVTGTGIHTNKKDSLQTVDFSQSTYLWSKMLPAYTGDESDESRIAVAKLMSDVGCAIDMDYGYYVSSAMDDAIIRALGNHFGYDKSMHLIYRTECSTEEWNDLLQNELNEKRPVLFGADAPSTGGHEFVIDGYDVNGLYHVNWGWSGMANGYFDMNIMDPKYQGAGGFAGGYSVGQVMVLGVKPDVEGTSVAKPELVVVRHLLLEEETHQWSYWVRNYGLGDFTGEIGVAMESPTGEISKIKTGVCDSIPVKHYDSFYFSFEAPVVPGPGYKLFVYYCDEIDGELNRIPVVYNGFDALYTDEYEGVLYWNYHASEVADINIDSVVVKHNFAGFSPQLNVTVTNSSLSVKEYADDMNIDICTMVEGVMKKVCSGYASVFLNPGETKEIVVRCSDVVEEFKDKNIEGECMYKLSLNLGGHYYPMDSASFEMVVTPPSDITYSDFAISKNEFLPEEEMTASMTVTNDGGFDTRNLMFVIARVSDKRIMDAIVIQNTDIEPNSSETITFRKILSYSPGEYMGAFYVNMNQLEGAPTLSFKMLDPTVLDTILSDSADDGESGIYDLQGRPVQQVSKGEVYIGKGKFVVKE